MSPDWPKRSTPERDDRVARYRAKPGQFCRVEVADRDNRRTGAQRHQQPLGRADRALHLGGAPIAVELVR
jgi:hypothetical protein